MKCKFTCIVALLFFHAANAQVMLSTQASNSGGSYFEDGDIKVTANIGEMTAVHSIFIPNLIVTNGVLQPLKSIRPNNNNLKPGTFKVYPTLLQGNTVTVEAQLVNKSHLKIRLVNGVGQTLKAWQFNEVEDLVVEPMQMPALLRGHYFMEVFLIDPLNGLPYDKKSFKIQKQ